MLSPQGFFCSRSGMSGHLACHLHHFWDDRRAESDLVLVYSSWNKYWDVGLVCHGRAQTPSYRLCKVSSQNPEENQNVRGYTCHISDHPVFSSFSGFPAVGNSQEHMDVLRKSLTKAGKIFNPHKYIGASYDGFLALSHYNEVWMFAVWRKHLLIKSSLSFSFNLQSHS